MKVWTTNSASVGDLEDLGAAEAAEAILAGPAIWATREAALDSLEADIRDTLHADGMPELPGPKWTMEQWPNGMVEWHTMVGDRMYMLQEREVLGTSAEFTSTDGALRYWIESLQAIQRAHRPTSAEWQIASQALAPLFAEMARRQEERNRKG